MKPRRWFRYSLRTFFVLVLVMAIPMGWLAVQVKWMQERHQARAKLTSWLANETGGMRREDVRAPWGLRLLGEPDISVVFQNGDTEYSAARLESLFPEALIAGRVSRVVDVPPHKQRAKQP